MRCNDPKTPTRVQQVGQFGGLADEVDALKRDKNVLMAELVRMRQHQQVQTGHISCRSVSSLACTGF